MNYFELLSTTFAPIGLLILFICVVALKTLYWIYVWQLKEYRTDRMVDFLGTHSGRHATTNRWNTIEFVFVMLFAVSEFLIQDTETVRVFLVLLFGVALFLEAIRYGRAHVLPVWTVKTLTIALGSGIVIFCSTIALTLWTTANLSFAILVVLIPLIVTTVVFVLRPLTTIQKQRTIRRAKEKIRQLRPIVIGVTGSYGKSSTKEFLNTILSQHYRVLATPKNVNVDIGVAQTILDQLTEKHQVFIVEMGAYQEGEIAAICDLVSPIIGIITTIKEQHLALFGSREAIKRAKAELYESLPSSGLAVVNRDNPLCMEVAEKVDARKKFFSTQEVAHIYATDIRVTPQEVHFLLHCGNEKMRAHSRLHGQQVIPAILAAALVADHLGMPLRDIVNGIATLKPIDGTMHLRTGKNHCTVIDDHYNSNPDGFMAAIDYLSIFHDRRKIILTPGMVELGSESDMHHRNVGMRAGEVCDQLIITKKDFAKPLKDAGKSGGLQDELIRIEERPGKLISEVLETFTPNDVVLVEGRIYASVLKELLKP